MTTEPNDKTSECGSKTLRKLSEYDDNSDMWPES